MAKVERMLTTEVTNSTLSYYTNHAEEYANQTQDLDFVQLWEMLRTRIPVGSTVLDLGCGAGRDLRALEVRDFRPIGLDLCAPLLRLARSFSGCPMVLADLRNIPFKKRSFEAVWAMASLLHVPRDRIADTLAGVYEVLAPGGIFVASIKLGNGEAYDRSGRLFTYYGCDEWRGLVEQAGFEIELLREDKEQRWSPHGENLSVDWLILVAQRRVHF